MANTNSKMWNYRDNTYRTDGLVDGFDVEARDGRIGHIDETSAEGHDRYLVVDTGFWIFGKKRLIPAGVVERIDYDEKKVYVEMTKDQIKNAPDLDETTDRTQNTWHRDNAGSYYDPYGF